MSISPPKMRRIGWVSGLLLLLAISGYFLFNKFAGSPDLATTVEKELVDLVSTKSHGLYRLRIGGIDIDGSSLSAGIHKISLEVDSTRLAELIAQKNEPATVYSFNLEHLRLSKADILAYISTKSINLHKLDISGGDLEITRLSNKKQTIDNKTGKEKLQQTIEEANTSVNIDTLHADQVNIGYRNLKKQYRSIKNVFLDLYQFSLDSTALEDSSRILFAQKMRLAIDSIRLPLKDNTYHLGARQLVMTFGDSSITSLKDVYLRPANHVSLEKMAGQMKEQQDVFSLGIKEILIDQLQLPALLEDSAIYARFMLVKGANLTIYHDQSLPPATETKIGKYPHQVIRQLPFSLRLPSILLEAGKLTYMEKNTEGDGEGKIIFTGIRGKIGPLNQESKKSVKFTAELEANFMGSAPLSARFEFPVSANGAFFIRAKFSPFPITLLNEATIPLGNVRLTNGRVSRLDFSLRGDNWSATGSTNLNYEGLKLDVLKPEKENGPQKNKLMSLIANTFLLHENNRPGDKFKDAYSVTYQRVPTKSFFNLVWKTVFYSIKANTGIGAKGKDKDRASIH